MKLQAAGLQSEYMRATTSSKDKPDAAADHRGEVAKLIQDKQRLQVGIQALRVQMKQKVQGLQYMESEL